MNRAISLLLVAGALAVVVAAPASAAAPAPCGGQAQITDVSGDGHHSSSDVLDAWFSEPSSGKLQATIRVKVGTFAPEHEDAEVVGSGFALLFTVGGATRFVRATAPEDNHGTLVYDYGTWAAGKFTSAGATTGTIVTGTPGTVTIDVPAATGAVDGARLTHPFVLTYDGITGGEPGWVDRAPGGTSPSETSTYGADFLVGSCTGAVPPGTVSAVQLKSTAVPVGGGYVAISGRVLPAAAGVAVTLFRAARTTVTTKFVTAANGTFSGKVPVRETTKVKAIAQGVASQSLTLTARSRVTVSLKRKHGKWIVSGTIAPRLPGRLQLLPVDGFTPVKTLRTDKATYTITLKRLPRDRYQVVWQPTGGRAETAVSRTIRRR